MCNTNLTHAKGLEKRLDLSLSQMASAVTPAPRRGIGRKGARANMTTPTVAGAARLGAASSHAPSPPPPPPPAAVGPPKPLWDPESICIMSGAGGDSLADEISGLIGLPSTSCLRARAGDGESQIQLGANVRARDVFVIQSTCTPVNSSFIELALIIAACKRGSARRVTAIVPYLGYSRQTRKQKSRVPVSAADVATIFEEMCVDMLITVDVHDSQIAGFYSPRCAFENCSILPTAARFLASSHELLSPVVVAPSAGLVERAMTFSAALREHLMAKTSTPSALRSADTAGRDGGGDDGGLPSASAHAPSVAEEPLERQKHRQPRGLPSARAAVPLAMLLTIERRGVKELEVSALISPHWTSLALISPHEPSLPLSLPLNSPD